MLTFLSTVSRQTSQLTYIQLVLFILVIFTGAFIGSPFAIYILFYLLTPDVLPLIAPVVGGVVLLNILLSTSFLTSRYVQQMPLPQGPIKVPQFPVVPAAYRQVFGS